MADIAPPPRRSALEGHYETGRFGTVRNDTPGITLQERRALSITHVDAWPDQAVACAKAIEKACGVAPGSDALKAVEKGETAVLWVGPDRWLVTEPESRDLPAALMDTVGGDLGAVTDQSHSRVCWRITGPALRQLLVKGSTIDFDQFGDGDCIGTLLGHFAVTIQSRGADSADVYCARSFAVDLHEWLVESSLEFGLEVAEPA